MTFFDDLISDGITAAENAWGTSFTVQGSSYTFTGTFDRHQDASAPDNGGYLDQISATIVCGIAQFEALMELQTEADLGFLTEEGDQLLTEDEGGVIPAIGKVLSHAGRQYLITGRELDAHSVTLTLKSINR